MGWIPKKTGAVIFHTHKRQVFLSTADFFSSQEKWIVSMHLAAQNPMHNESGWHLNNGDIYTVHSDSFFKKENVCLNSVVSIIFTWH